MTTDASLSIEMRIVWTNQRMPERILQVLGAAPEGITLADLAKCIGSKTKGSTRVLVNRLRHQGHDIRHPCYPGGARGRHSGSDRYTLVSSEYGQ
jgi:fructose-1,6-bisphosphatase/sedoheptulose 1,7-bisphosphatase-like protein